MLFHEGNEILRVSRATVTVDIDAIRLCIEYGHFSAQSFQCSFCSKGRGTICTIHGDLHAGKIQWIFFNDPVKIVFQSLWIGNDSADGIICCIRDIHLTIQIVFDQFFDFSLQFDTLFGEYLDSIIIIWIMTCGNHCTTGKIFIDCQITHARCRTETDKICITTRCCDS